MAYEGLLRLSRDLEWLGVELEHCGHRHAMRGYPGTGPEWEEFLEKQKGVLQTCDKIEHELKTAVRFNTRRLVGVVYPLDEALEVVARLFGDVEDIKRTTLEEVHDLPEKVRAFNQVVREVFGAPSVPAGPLR